MRGGPLTLPLPAWGEENSYSRTAIIFGSRLEMEREPSDDMIGLVIGFEAYSFSERTSR